MIFDRPTSAELVEVVSEFLEKETKSQLPNHLAFKTQIAINVLNIVKRELTNEEVLTKESTKILMNLFKDSDEASIENLAKQIEICFRKKKKQTPVEIHVVFSDRAC